MWSTLFAGGRTSPWSSASASGPARRRSRAAGRRRTLSGAGGQRRPRPRRAGPPSPRRTSAARLDQHRGRDGQRDRGEQLVGDAEEREDWLIPPSGSSAGVEEVAPGADHDALVTRPGFHRRATDRLPDVADVSCSKKRPTRVPASTVVRINSASNMIAKWYQKAFRPSPVAPEKISDMPTASVGPARAGDRAILRRRPPPTAAPAG